MIKGVGNHLPVQKVVTQPVHKQIPADPPKQIRAMDKLEVAGVSHMLASLKAQDVRMELVTKIRKQIEAGKYETEAKIDAAVGRVMAELGE
jgi:anti-sigma28 factor (negative regulator of flagellin synthesis)